MKLNFFSRLLNTSKLPIILFVIYFISGLLVYKDYGVSYDEGTERHIGIMNIIHVARQLAPSMASKVIPPDLKNAPDMEHYRDRDHGALFAFPMVVLEKGLGIDDELGVYRLWHLSTFLIFALSIIFLYKLLSERFQKQYISLLGCFIYVFSPRFLAESFYNPKDLPLLSLFVIAGYLGFKILKGTNYKYAIGLGLVMGLATALRIVGIFLPLIFGGAIVLKHFFTQEKDLVQKLKMLASMLIVYLLTFYIAFPYLWTNPIGHFIEVFENLSKYPLNAPVLFEGQYYTAPDLPRYYALIWIVITTPIPFLLLALIGVVVTLKQWITEYRNPLTYINLFFLGLFVGPILSVVVLDSTLYDGWRHLYFTYAGFVYLATLGIVTIEDFLKGWKPAVAGGFIGLNVLVVVYLLAWIVKNHPYQNVYFNVLAGNHVDKKFEMDYWGTSYKQALDYLKIHSQKGAKVKINGNICASYNLGKSEKDALKFVSDINQADYFITEYRHFNFNPDFSAYLVPSKEVFNVEVDGNKVISIYRLK